MPRLACGIGLTLVDVAGNAGLVCAGLAVSYMSVGYWPTEFEARWAKRGI